MTDCPCDLNGLRVLVTRPRGQAGPLAEAIRDCGGQVERMPLLAIEAAVSTADTDKLRHAADYDDLLFVSPNAVRHATGLLAAGKARVIAIGEATAALLEDNGIAVAIVPQRSTSESLLDDVRIGPMAGRRVLIVRGQGGRELLAGSLREAGAHVDYAEVYRRAMPPAPPVELMQAWGERVDAIIVTSEQMLKNLLELTQKDRRVLETPLVVISERLQYAANTLGFTDILQAHNPYPADLLRTLCRLAGRQ
ncbi:MAG: uroporphyrinogen-III synthase [Gammaproteobacteria bacterium]|jgi:uroporphyrinogen-III synthase